MIYVCLDCRWIGAISTGSFVMKAYSLELRKRIVAFLEDGGSAIEAAKRFKIGRRTVYRYITANKNGQLAPKTSWGHWRKLDPDALEEVFRKNPDATLMELQETFNVSASAIWYRLKKMGVSLKRSHTSSRKKERGRRKSSKGK